MFTNSEILKAFLKSKGFSMGYIYTQVGQWAFFKNRFSKDIIEKLERITGEDLSMFINV